MKCICVVLVLLLLLALAKRLVKHGDAIFRFLFDPAIGRSENVFFKIPGWPGSP